MPLCSKHPHWPPIEMTISNYTSLLSRFQDAILQGDATPVEGMLHGKPEFPPRAQIGVYIEGYRLRLLGTVREDYRALESYLGTAAFEALARGFIEATPSHSYSLNPYSHPFAEYVKTHVADGRAHNIAAVEAAIGEVFTLPDSDALDAQWLAAQDMETLASTAFAPRAALRCLELEYDADAAITHFREHGACPPPAPAASRIVVRRHEHIVRRVAMEEMEYRLFAALIHGRTLAQIAESSDVFSEEELAGAVPKLQEWFTRWLSEGLFRAHETDRNAAPL